MKTVLIFTTALIFVFFSACKEKQAPKKETPVQVVKRKTRLRQVEAEKTKDVKPVVKEKKNYFLVAGCFEYKSNADKLCQDSKKKVSPKRKY